VSREFVHYETKTLFRIAWHFWTNIEYFQGGSTVIFVDSSLWELTPDWECDVFKVSKHRLFTKTLGWGALRVGRDALITSWAVKYAFKRSGNSSVGSLCLFQCSVLYVFLVISLIVKCSREQALIHRWQRSIRCEGFGKGINIFIPNSNICFSDLCSLSGYLESLLHVPRSSVWYLPYWAK